MGRLLLPLVACALALVPVPHDTVERVYSQQWYAHLQPMLTGASNVVPFAWLDPILVAIAAAVLMASVRAWRRARGRWRRGVDVLGVLLQATAAVYIAFLLVWGLNYRRTDAPERLQVSRARLTPAGLARLGTLAVARVNALHDPARDDARLTGEPLMATMSAAFAGAEQVLGSTWHATPGRPKASFIGHAFPWTGVDGMINPLALEVILNPAVLPFERPFVLAHEWAHLAGHARESAASAVAFVACLQGTRDAQYSGWLALVPYVLQDLPPAAHRDLIATLGLGPRADLRAIAARQQRVQPLVHHVSWSVYDQYLRANRVASGVANYDEVVVLVLGSRLLAPLIDR